MNKTDIFLVSIIGLVLIIGIVLAVTSTTSTTVAMEPVATTTSSVSTTTPTAPTTPTSTSTERVREPEQVMLSVGQTKEAAGLSITLNSVVQDNRCGVDALCQEAGGITVNVTLKSGEEEITKNIASDDAAYVFEGYAVSIPVIAPARLAGQTILNADYKITFKVTPQASGDTV